MRKLEALFCGFIGVMALSFAWMFGETNPNGKAMAAGQFSTLSCSIFFFLFFVLLVHLVLYFHQGIAYLLKKVN